MRYGPAMSAPRRAKPAITFRVSAGCPHDAPRRQTALTSCSPSRGFASRRKRWDDERIAETGLVLMAMSTTGWQFSLATGLFIGLAQGCTTFSIVFGVVSRVFPPERRSMALGLSSAAGSFGQFAMLPYTQTLISHFGWFNALLTLAVSAALIAPLASALVEKRGKDAGGVQAQSVGEAVREAFAHRSFLLLTAGYFVCGFQLAFITIHFPAYLVDKGLSANVGMFALALVGLFNIFGSFASGALGAKYTKKYLLSSIYLSRSVVIALFILAPVSEGSVYLFSAAIGLLWLSTVPLTNGVIGGIFGIAYMSTLSGFVFFSHQIGSFIGVWLGGYLFDHTGSYRVVWLISIALGIFAALVNLPIEERAIERAPCRARRREPSRVDGRESLGLISGSRRAPPS